ncbi:1528_t:CDS:2 [Ambispora gerdemannii]|uniref:1528_t:CDS:1 n=1 Tax=Ambispora gerdemannii TaxID=144530 RepID=A0A9N9A1I4_9GLOM|nr:1528_t:CDS:2 [Ambispora gerdemannii]
MPVQDKCAIFFERPVTRSQTKSLNNSNSGTKLSSTNSSRYGGVNSVTAATNQKNNPSYNCYSTTSSTTTTNSANASNVMNHSATNTSSNLIYQCNTTTTTATNKSKDDSSSRILASSSNSYRISDWAPDTPEYTPDHLSQYGFDDVFDQAFATALVVDLNSLPYTPPSPPDDSSSPIFIDQDDEIEDLVVLDGECVTDPFSLAEKKLPITREILFEIKTHLDLEDTEDAMFWCLCTLAFHSLARINELVTNTKSKEPLQIEVEQVKAPKVYVVPYACIRIPYQKNEYAKIRHLVVCPSNDDICPLTALSNYCRIRTQEGYASDRDPFFCFKGGEVASRKWFLHKLDPLLPNGDASRYSFRAGGVLDLVAQGRTKPDIRCLGRWNYNSFEHYLNDHPSVLLAFISASITTAYEYGDSMMI